MNHGSIRTAKAERRMKERLIQEVSYKLKAQVSLDVEREESSLRKSFTESWAYLENKLVKLGFLREY